MIVSEKPIAGKHIAQILSQGNYKERKKGRDPFYTFDNSKFGDVTLVPLKGHISDVDFPSENANWHHTKVKDLADIIPVVYKQKEKGIISLLKKYSKDADQIIIATDADREGESIGREAVEYAKMSNPKIDVKRAYFSAITDSEINNSFSKLEKLNYDIADAADSRREIDLIWGAALTRHLSLSTKNTGKGFLSVGRVQSPTLAKIVERELEIEAFKPVPYFEIELTYEKEKTKFLAKHKTGRFSKKEDAEKAFEKSKDIGIVTNIDKKKKSIKKPVPFNTTDFLRASAALGFDAMYAMDLAEKLYMEGYISYPRTDNQCYEGIDYMSILNSLKRDYLAKDAEKILSLDKIVPSRGKKTKDHPPIYPVAFMPKDRFGPKEYKIYRLIVDRFFATLAKDAQVFVTKIDSKSGEEPYISRGSIIQEKGWLEFYPYSKVKEETLPEIVEGEELKIVDRKLLSKETKPPARYSQGTLIKLMEDLNLGTKSTRPAIIKKLYDRRYIEGRKMISPTKISKAIVVALKNNAKDIVESEMTADLEQDMNRIEEKKNNKNSVVKKSREVLSKFIDTLENNKLEISKHINKNKYEIEDFGPCPKCGSMLRKMKSKRGKWFVSCSAFPKCRQSYPLPQKGEYTRDATNCATCGSPKIDVKKEDGSYTLCINLDCPTNKKEAQK